MLQNKVKQMSRTTTARGGRGRFGGRGPAPDPYYRYETIDEYFDSLPDDINEICLIQKEIEYLPELSRFNNLKHLYCNRNNLTYLPELPDSLIYLNCSHNQLTSLPELSVNLKDLNCCSNQLTYLSKLPDSLKNLICDSNQLTYLSKLPDSLTYLNCDYNQLTSLTELPKNLIQLRCNYNQLTSLQELPDSLTCLNCHHNQLTSLPELPNSLKVLNCDYNQLTSLPELPEKLERLDCHYNQLTSLPELPENLIRLECGYNQLTSLPDLKNMRYIELFGNPIYDYVCSLEMIENDYNIIEGIIVDGGYDINTIKPNVKILNKFRFLYYSLKFKNKFRDWLWKKVREPKIQQQYHPSRLAELLKHEDIDDIDEEKFNNW
jgi:Leucine-rich repeat (LRR) protein